MDQMALRRAIIDQVQAALLDQKRSMRDLALATGIPFTTFQRRLSGLSPFTTDELAAIGASLGLSMAGLLGPVAVAS